MSKPAKTYTPDQLALFAQFVEARADCRPHLCHRRGSSDCWVIAGPPVLDNDRCIGCGGTIRNGYTPKGRVAYARTFDRRTLP